METEETNKDYENIDRPYDSSLNRSDLSDNNGSVMEQPVKSDGDIGNIWIKNFIASENWHPKKVGFYINGQTGYAEFANVYISGDIHALTGEIGGFVIGEDYLRDTADTFGLSSTITGNDDVRMWAGDSFANRAIAPFSVKESGNVIVNVLTNKSILFENVTSAPAAVDGQLWTDNNMANKKVLWGYFGGDTTNKQQISMSRMQLAGSFDDTGTSTYQVINIWFQPRILVFNGYFQKLDNTILGVTNGQAGSVQSTSGFCNSIQLTFTAGTLTSTAVTQSDNSFASSENGLGAVTAAVTVWGNTNLTFVVTVTAGWRLTGNYMILG